MQNSGPDGVEAGANMIGGALLALGPIRPFAQARLTIASSTRFSLAGGVLLRTW